MAKAGGVAPIAWIGGAAVIAVGVAVMVQSWTAGDRGVGTSVRELADAHRQVHGYALATIYDVNDPNQVLNLPAREAPGAELSVRPAADGGWDLVLDVSNFRFAANPLDDRHVPGHGHAHIFVDGQYFADFSSRAHYLPPLDPGVHEIAVSLNTMDHRAYARDGRVVVERVVLRVGDPRRRRPATEPKAFDLAVQNGKVAGTDTQRVKQGEWILLRWTADAPMNLHLEGYDMEMQVSPRSPAAMQFVADLPGRFPVELHGAGGAHGRGAVFYLEVYP
ncbi:MAG: hypothetical protein FJX64_08020 [Alphaproteobacteria bacterium]|nr:hypothetical protein [Alphaproteobacteria bacterium]